MAATTAGALAEPTFLHVADLLGHAGHPNQQWREHAQCRGADPRIFIRERGQDLEPARAFCRACEVKLPCLEYAMSLPDALCHGVWGGASGRDRVRARRRGWDPRRLLAELEDGTHP